MKRQKQSKQNLDGVQTLTNDPLATYQVVGGGATKVKRLKKRK
jgi:hypothetical protein